MQQTHVIPKLTPNKGTSSLHICYQQELYSFLHKFSRLSLGVKDLAVDYIMIHRSVCVSHVLDTHTKTHTQRACYTLQSNTDGEPVCFPSVSSFQSTELFSLFPDGGISLSLI